MEVVLLYNLRPGVRNYNGTVYSGAAVQKVVDLLRDKIARKEIKIVNFGGAELNGIELVSVNSKLFTFNVHTPEDWNFDNMKVTAEIFTANGFKNVTDAHILDVSGKIVLVTNSEYARRNEISISQ